MWAYYSCPKTVYACCYGLSDNATELFSLFFLFFFLSCYVTQLMLATHRLLKKKKVPWRFICHFPDFYLIPVSEALRLMDIQTCWIRLKTPKNARKRARDANCMCNEAIRRYFWFWNGKKKVSLFLAQRISFWVFCKVCLSLTMATPS